jgi:PKD domain
VVQSPTQNTTTFATGNGIVADLGIELGGGSSGTALFFGGTAVDVAITAPPGTTGGLGVSLHGGSSENGTVTLPTAPAVTTGVANGISAGGAVQDSTVTATTALNGIVNVSRDRIFASTGINLSNGSPGGCSNRQFFVEDALVDTTAAGIVFGAGSSLSGSDVTTTLTIRHSTLIGGGAGGSTGVGVTAQTSSSFVAAEVSISGTIVRGYATAISQVSTGGGGHGASANIFDDYSDFNPALKSQTNNGTPVGSGAISDGIHNLNVDPGFVSTTPSDPLAFRLLAASPLIDSGLPGLSGGESPLDLAGAPRAVADHGGAVPLSDIGAFEYQPRPPAVIASAGARAVAIRHPAAFRANASDPDPGDQLTFTWSFDDGGTASGANVGHTFATPGLHTATVTVTDLDGLRASAAAQVLVVAPGKITRMRVKPSTLVPARSGPSIAAARGALISYSDSAAATTTFTVARKTRRHGLKTIGRFKHSDVQGSNRFRFSGRVGGHRLTPGSYRLQAVASNIAGHGPAAFATFSVRG